MKSEVYYAIDMGAPSGKYSGFFCWRYDISTGDLTAFDGKDGGWRKCINGILADANDSIVHLTIEAALWGMKDNNENWIVRFSLENYPHYTERPWYSGAGASTGLMAQEFLHQLKSSPEKSIIVHESYISGLKYNKKQKRGEKKDHPKPEECIISDSLSIISRSHAHDAFEGLLLTLEEVKGSLDSFKFKHNGNGISIEQWTMWPKTKIQQIKMNQKGEAFGIGILNREGSFQFELGKILFTKREFNKLFS